MLDAAVKGLLYLGVVLLLGAELFRRLLAPELGTPRARRAVRLSLLAGAALVLIFSALNLATTLRAVVGFLEAELLLEYARASLHGRASLLRAGLVLVVVALAFTPARRAALTAVWLLASVGLLGTFSFISHNASMPGWLPIPADLAHITAAVSWAGAVLGVAFVPDWRSTTGAHLTRAVERVSTIGLLSVLTLFATGIYSAQLHVWQASSLVTTQYGWTLTLKVTLVLVILAIAALNRWRFLPALRRHGPSAAFGRALRIEAVLLLVVLAATGLLTVSPVPHD